MIRHTSSVYEYFGAHTLRVFNYPLVIGVLETAQVIGLCTAATALRRHVGEGWGLLNLFLLFPVVFYGINFGPGALAASAIGVTAVCADAEIDAPSSNCPTAWVKAEGMKRPRGMGKEKGRARKAEAVGRASRHMVQIQNRRTVKTAGAAGLATWLDA